MPDIREDGMGIIIKKYEEFYCDDEMILHLDCRGGYKICTCSDIIELYVNDAKMSEFKNGWNMAKIWSLINLIVTVDFWFW